MITQRHSRINEFFFINHFHANIEGIAKELMEQEIAIVSQSYAAEDATYEPESSLYSTWSENDVTNYS